MESQTTERKTSLSPPEVSWDELETHGFYVSRAPGNGYRVPAEALIKGASPVIEQVSAQPTGRRRFAGQEHKRPRKRDASSRLPIERPKRLAKDWIE
jgi:hypothetical protein